MLCALFFNHSGHKKESFQIKVIATTKRENRALMLENTKHKNWYLPFLPELHKMLCVCVCVLALDLVLIFRLYTSLLKLADLFILHFSDRPISWNHMWIISYPRVDPSLSYLSSFKEILHFDVVCIGLRQGHIESEAHAEPSAEILIPVCLKPEEGLEVWRLWAQRKNVELDKQETTKLAPIGRKSSNGCLNTHVRPWHLVNSPDI